jgi:UDP-MurNAc hydroxylase
MIFQFITNACGIIHGNSGTRIITDPWLNDGVMEGSWCNHPPITSRTLDFHNVDLIYLSHLHPDHYDSRFFDFPKSTPIVTLDHGNNYLKKILIKNGYTNLIMVKDNCSVQFKEFNITMFAPFVKHGFEDYEENQIASEIGNLIDSAMLVQTNEFSIMNFNDNKPDEKACSQLKKKYGHIDLALLNYNAANCYPACFQNLSHDEKILEKNRILIRNYDHMIDLINELNPKTVFPFAGSYILGGTEYEKNKYLAVDSAEECKNYIANQVESSVINLSENNRFDLKNDKVLDRFIEFSLKQTEELIENKLKYITYPHENDKYPDIHLLIEDTKKASIKMNNKMTKFGFKCNTNVNILIDNKSIEVFKPINETELSLECSMDPRLLRRILNREANWNNAEIGAHINFVRNPNTNEPDIHTALQFLHL